MSVRKMFLVMFWWVLGRIQVPLVAREVIPVSVTLCLLEHMIIANTQRELANDLFLQVLRAVLNAAHSLRDLTLLHNCVGPLGL